MDDIGSMHRESNPLLDRRRNHFKAFGHPNRVRLRSCSALEDFAGNGDLSSNRFCPATAPIGKQPETAF